MSLNLTAASLQVVEVAPVFLEAMCRWQGGGMVARVVLAELARGIAKIAQEHCMAGVPGRRYDGLPRPEVQLCMAR